MACLIALLLGGIAYFHIPVDLMPETIYPTLTVTTEYEGVAPEEIETLVTRPLEEALSASPGVEKVTSRSSEGRSFIRIHFTFGTDIDEAANELRTRIDRRRASLPDDMEPPVVYKFDVSQFPIMFLNVAAAGMDPKRLRHFVEKSIQYRFERVPGVAQFTVRGGLRREIHVDLDLKKLRALDLSIADIAAVIRRENLNRPVGPVHEGRFELLVRTQGEYRNLEQLRSVVVTTRNRVPIFLRELGTVEDSHEDVIYKVSVDGEPAVRLFIYKQAGANTVEVSNGVWEEVKRIHRDFPNVSISATGDTADFIKEAIDNVTYSALTGSVLAVFVLLFFLRGFSSTLIVGTAIPIAVISTFALMFFNGFTLNVVSFGGLALGVGMLVDNAIVVLENIFRHREQGNSLKEAAQLGSKEVQTAITASTLTTVVVFLPVVFIGGMSAQTFKQLAYVVTFSLLTSLVVALTMIPMLCSRILRVNEVGSGPGGLRGFFCRLAERIPERLRILYVRFLGWAIGHRLAVVLPAIALMVVAVILSSQIGFELHPELDEGELRVNVELEPGTRVEVTEEIMQRLQMVVRDSVPEARYVMVQSGSFSFFRAAGQHVGELRIGLVERSERERSSQQIASAIRPLMQIEPGMRVRVRSGGGFFRRLTSGSFGDDSRLEIEVRGHDLQVLSDLARRVQEEIMMVDGVADTDMSMKPGLPEMLVTVDRPKAASMGLNVSHVADTLETAIGGRRASMFRQEGDEFNILVRLRQEDRLGWADVGQVPLTTPLGRTIPAKTVVRMHRQEGPIQISRVDQQRIIVVSGVLEDRDLGSVISDIDTALRKVPRPPGYEFIYGGEYEEQQKAYTTLTYSAVLALLLVYMVMASQFESLRDPFIILFSVPFATVGVVAMLLLTGTTFNIQAFLGIIVLVGIVVNNAIVLVDYTNRLRREQEMPIGEAVIIAGSRRLRPILMTTSTTVLALIPMALGIGEGAELQAPLARVVIGGLLSSTVITLILVPLIYLIMEGYTQPKTLTNQIKALTKEMEPFPVKQG